MGNMFLNKRTELTLPDGDYEWTVQAIDAARFGGFFAPMQPLNIKTGLTDFFNLKPTVFGQKKMLSIRSNSFEKLHVKVYSMLGQQVIDTYFVSTFDKTMEKGVYLVVVNGKTDAYKTKIIIQ